MIHVSEIADGLKKLYKNNDSGVSIFSELDPFKDEKNWYSSDSPDIDLVLNTFGFPSGIIEVYGDYQSGKTTLMYHFLKQVQKNGSIPILISTERRNNKFYAATIGVNTNGVLLYKVRTVEKGFARFEKAVSFIREKYGANVSIGVAWDSVGGTATKAELEAKDEDQEFMAIAARVIKRGVRRVTAMLDDEQVTFFAVNQIYAKVGNVWGKKTQAYGGSSIKFHATIRIEVIRTSNIYINKIGVGQIVKFMIIKNDFGMPLRSVDVPLLWGYGLVPGKDLLEWAAKKGILREYKFGYQMTKFPAVQWKKLDDYYMMCIEKPHYRNLLNSILLKAVHEEVKERRGL